jgi:NOL1/NOP2/fmu family ribosome biogenesis protein
MFHAGAYYVQEASSMFLEQAVKAHVTTPVRCLDLCASPGGKSTHLCSILPEGSLLVSNEVIRSRAQTLHENLTKWGSPDVIISRDDPETIGRLTGFFDLIMADIPCSGEGMFRKYPRSAGEWSQANVALCAARGRRIIHDVWNALRPGGILIYSTCTYNAEENEENVHHIASGLGATPLPIPTDPEWRIAGGLRHPALPAYRFFPHRTMGEGFFLSVMRKDCDGAGFMTCAADKPVRAKAKTLPLPSGVHDRLLHPEKFHIERCGNTIRAIPHLHAGSYERLSRRLNILQGGIDIGEIKGKDLLPPHSLAMSAELNRSAFAIRETDREEALRYLRKETLSFTGEKGFTLICHRGLALGFVKQAGNRSNNLYPREWRIRSQRSNCSTTLISPSLGAGCNPSNCDTIR